MSSSPRHPPLARCLSGCAQCHLWLLHPRRRLLPRPPTACCFACCCHLGQLEHGAATSALHARLHQQRARHPPQAAPLQRMATPPAPHGLQHLPGQPPPRGPCVGGAPAHCGLPWWGLAGALWLAAAAAAELAISTRRSRSWLGSMLPALLFRLWCAALGAAGAVLRGRACEERSALNSNSGFISTRKRQVGESGAY